ncbi:MAG: hypothetical protein KKF27_21085, partial [Gammaproteobacteria bacterium]|nr:hypothetical protein [Gammaproteobacteria bacterium]
MIVGLYNLEPKIENTAMMQVSQYHKQKGDTVEMYHHLFPERYDMVYAFSLFKETNKSMVRDSMIKGGTGFDIKTRLPLEIEACAFDYSIFPNCETSYIWFSRGCFRDCPFCVVRKKEGFIHAVEPKDLNPKGKYISIMDNNFFGSPKWREAIDKLVEWNQPVDIQGMDVRIFTKDMGEALQRLRIYKQLHIAWDNPKDDLTEKINLLTKYIKPSKIMCYVLIGYWSTPEEDLMRVEKLRE